MWAEIPLPFSVHMSSIAQATCPNTLRIGEMQIMLVVNGDAEKIDVSKIDIILILRTYLIFVLELQTFKISVVYRHNCCQSSHNLRLDLIMSSHNL